MVKLIVTPTVYGALDCAAALAADKSQETLLFTEDKCTATLERAVLTKVPGQVSFHAEVTTFSRFLLKYGTEVGALSKEGSSMLIRRILAESEGEFCLLPPVGGKKSLAATLYDMLAQLKSACVDGADLMRANEGERGLFSQKLTDLALLSEKYAAALNSRGKTDQSGLMNLLPPLIRESGIVKDKRIILTGYTAFTRQMERVIRALLSAGREVIAVLPAGTAMRAQAVETFRAVVKDAGMSLTEETLDAPQNVAQRLLRTLYSTESYIGGAAIPAKSVAVFRASTPEEEVERLALTVIRRVREGARYRDFTVVCADAQSYLPLFTRILKKYEIPFYADVKYTLARHPLMRFLLAALSVGANGAVLPKVAEVVNSAYFPIRQGVPEFLAYAKRSAAIGNRFYAPFTLPLPGKEDAERVRVAFAHLCPVCKEKATAAEYLAYVNGLLSGAQVERVSADFTAKMRAEYPELADFTRQAPTRITELLEETERVLGDTLLTATEFYDVLKAGAEAVETSVLPTRLDALTVAPPEKACIRCADYVFALGMTSDFPAVTEDTAFLSERDLLTLEEKGVPVDPNLQEMNERAKRHAVYALTAFRKNLIVSYPAVNVGGEETRESEIVTLIKRNCIAGDGTPLAEVTAAEIAAMEDALPAAARLARRADAYLTQAAALERFYRGVSAYAEGEKNSLEEESGYYAFVQSQKQDLQEIPLQEQFPGEELPEGVRGTECVGSILPRAISATALQNYFSCPYRYFLSKTLGVKEPQEAKIASNESGTLMHAVYEAFGKEMSLRDVGEQEIPALVEKIFSEVIARPEFEIKRGQVRNEVAFARMLQESLRGCTALHAHFSRASLRISAVEKNLLEDYKNAPLTFAVGNKKIPLTGVVDRIDTDGEFFRIVDYKTGKVECKTKELFTGRHLQLELYLLAVKNLLQKRPVGGYYFFSKDAYEETPAPVLLYGKTVKDESALIAQDRGFAAKGESPQESVVLPYSVSVNSKGETQYSGDGAKSLLIEEDTFAAHLSYAFMAAESALRDMESGFVYPTPYEGVCRWCKYGGICGRSVDFYGEGRKISARVEHKDIENAVLAAKGEQHAR